MKNDSVSLKNNPMTNKMKDFLNNNKMVFAVVATLLVVGGLRVVSAYSGAAQNVTESGDINVYNQVSSLGAASEEVLGSAEMPDCANNTRLGGCPTTFGNTFIDGSIEVDGVFYSDGDTRAQTLVEVGALATFTASSTATAAQVCNSPHWVVTPASSTPTITLPATTTLFADCLTTIGDTHTISVATLTTSTIIAIGTGGDLDLSTTATITANKSAIIRFIRLTATTYQAILINANS